MAELSRGRIAAAVLAGLVILWLGARWLESGRIAPGLAATGTATAPQAPLGEALRETEPIRHEVIGSVQSRFPVAAASRVAARVVAVEVHAGERVRAGQTLVTLDSADLRAGLAQAEGELAAANGELSRARADESRYAALYPRGSVTASERDTAEAAYRAAAGRAEQARAAVAQARAALAYATVKSPADGVVIERMVERGDLAMPGQPLVRLYNESAMRVELEVPEALARQIRIGQPLAVSIDAASANLEVSVNEIVPAADPRSRTFLVRAMLPSAANLRPGMFARATFTSGTETVLTVPADAVVRVGQLTSLRIYQRGATVVRMVSIGRRFGDRIEILAGVNPGEKVLLVHSRSQTIAGQTGAAQTN
ncbi:efflux RND transporter periplasmic adaptor subunit [bacterium]|nr:efflux RND transporter periplasmic adaptor subunit [bacterium]